MMQQIKTEYRGIEITYIESLNQWSAELDRDMNDGSLAGLKKKLDAFFKKESEYREMPCLRIGGGWREREALQKVTITSVTPENEVWVRDEKGKREKVYESSRNKLVKETPENLAIYEEIKKLEEQRLAIQKQIAGQWAMMERVFKITEPEGQQHERD